MLTRNAIPLPECSAQRSAVKFLSFSDQWDSPKVGAVCIDGQSEILGAYHLLDRLTEKIRGGDEIEIAIERQSANGDKNLKRGRDYELLSKCLKINPLMAERYDLLPDMVAWLEQCRDQRFSVLAAIRHGQQPLTEDAIDSMREILACYRAVITDHSHRKLFYNAAGSAKRRRHSMMKVIKQCYYLCDEPDIGLLDLSWTPECRTRKTLTESCATYTKFINGVRHHTVSRGVMAAIFCMESSDSKGIHISGLVLSESGSGNQAANLGRYWRDNVTKGEGSFLCATDRPFASILSKWSGFPVTGLATPVDVNSDPTPHQFLEAVITRFAELSPKLRANGEGRKHRQIRIFKGEKIRSLAKIVPSVVDSGGEKW